MKYKCIFFDFDGTIMDTSEGIYSGGRYAMEKAGIPIPENAEWRRFIGPPLKDCFRFCFHIEDEETLKQLSVYYREYYHAHGLTQAVFYPGFPEVLAQLKKQGYILGITSMKNSDLVEKMCVIFDIMKYFDGIFGLNLEGTNTKADVIMDGMKKFGLAPEECVLVGDTQVDSDGAEKAGIDCIKVSWGFGFAPGEKGAANSAFEIPGMV